MFIARPKTKMWYFDCEKLMLYRSVVMRFTLNIFEETKLLEKQPLPTVQTLKSC